ncbi:MAG: DUF3109 family protein [Candidatus Delongbacteria bacterium]|jgi:hypothetical protein|nr:DUF3109 family protein [Candidatus Delongbacteria bacterium]
MIPIKNTLVSRNLVDVFFACDMAECKGACCVQGDSGPPITQEEKNTLINLFPKLKPYMKPESVKRAVKHGLSFVDQENEMVAMIHENSGECIFAIQKDGITKCVIEGLYLKGKIDFRKPVSCHLYPVRVKTYPDFTAVNIDSWDICKPALQCGEKLRMPLYKFVKDALIRRFGKEWYAQLEIAAEDFSWQKNNKNV